MVTNPKNMLPTKPPTHNSDAIQEASSMLIFLPEASGVSLEVSRMMLGLVQPQVIPQLIVSRFTAHIYKYLKVINIFFMEKLFIN